MGQVQVLVSVMNQTDRTILDQMGIRSDTIVINQCQKTQKQVFEYKGHTIQWYDFEEKGAALSRNTALNRVSASYGIFADDDIRYVNGYEDMIALEFEKHPEADVILFNVKSLNPQREIRLHNNWERVRIWNGLRYGTFNIAFRTEKIKKKNISFHLLFGGGGQFGSGEDTLFIADLLKNNIRVYRSPKIIATAGQESSTWFHGYNEKYLFDKGVLFSAIFPKAAFLYTLRYLLKYKNEYKTNFSTKKAWQILRKGTNYWKSL